MKLLAIATLEGDLHMADSIFMVPHTIEILADVIFEAAHLSREEILWLGSPS